VPFLEPIIFMFMRASCRQSDHDRSQGAPRKMLGHDVEFLKSDPLTGIPWSFQPASSWNAIQRSNLTGCGKSRFEAFVRIGWEPFASSAFFRSTRRTLASDPGSAMNLPSSLLVKSLESLASETFAGPISILNFAVFPWDG